MSKPTKTLTPGSLQSQGTGEPQTQSERFIAKARELGLDEREEAFDAALTKVARHKPQEPKPTKN